MGNSAQQTVINRLKTYFSSGWLEKASRSNPDFAAQIENLTADKIFFGNKPTYFQGYIEGNCTAVGEKSDSDSTLTRTISLDFTTETYIFIENENDIALSKYAHGIFRSRYNLHKFSEKYTLAEKCGKRLATEDLNDLNFFRIKEYRLNRHRFIKTDEYDLPVWPIYANLGEKSVFLGYWVENNGNIDTEFNISIPLTKKQRLLLTVIIGGIALAIIFFFIFSKFMA